MPDVPKYKKGFPFTGDNPAKRPYDVYHKAVVRDSSRLSTFMGSVTADPNIEQNLQINRELRQKAQQQNITPPVQGKTLPGVSAPMMSKGGVIKQHN